MNLYRIILAVLIGSTTSIVPTMITAMQMHDQQQSIECPVCMLTKPLSEIIILTCSHPFCTACLAEHHVQCTLEKKISTCPPCRRNIFGPHDKELKAHLESHAVYQEKISRSVPPTDPAADAEEILEQAMIAATLHADPIDLSQQPGESEQAYRARLAEIFGNTIPASAQDEE